MAQHVSLLDRHVELAWATGETHAVPIVWLRDNCQCDQCRITSTGEHRYFLGAAPELPTAISVSLLDGQLRIDWSDGHRSDYGNDDFVRLNSIGARTHPVAELWVDDFEPKRFDRSEILYDDATQLEFLSAALRDGLVIVTGMPNESGACIQFLDELKLPVRDTPFDRLHDVFFRSDGYNVAHTSEALPLHNDFASYTWPPSGQLLHMLVNDATGGEWVNADGFKVLANLWRTNPDAIQTLASVPVAFREHADYAESWTRAPIVRIDSQGAITGIRFSNQLMQPMAPTDPNVEAFYEAYHLLARAINDPKNQIEMTARAGTMQFVHGHRILHARRAFDGSSGTRHLQDTYFEFDDVASLAAMLAGEAR